MTQRFTFVATAAVVVCGMFLASGAGLTTSSAAGLHGAAQASATTTPTATPASQHTPSKGTGTLITLPKPIAVTIGLKLQGQGLSPKQAFMLANKSIPQFLLQAPTYVPKGFTLENIQVYPPQDQQTPPAAYLEYVPTGLSRVGRTFPSYQIFKQLGASPIVNPGGKLQTVVISKGVNGVGAVSGTLVDMKFKNGVETVHIYWTIASISYEVTSNVTLSKLSVADLLKVAAGVQ